MRVTNFELTTSENNTIFSADFIFHKSFPLSDAQALSTYRHHKIRHKVLHPLTPYSHTHRVWFKVPTRYAIPLELTNVFFLISLIMALRIGEDLIYDGEVSSELVSKYHDIETFFRFEHHQRHATVTFTTPPTRHHKNYQKQGIGQFFSLGLDSFYTLLGTKSHHRPQANYLVFVGGYDVPLSHQKFLSKICKNISSVASATNTKMIYVESNLRDFSDQIVNWGQFHMAALCAVASLLPLPSFYINGESFDWPDWGLRFGIDKLFSTTSHQFHLVGHNLTRDIKIKSLQSSLHFNLLLKYIRVCWKNVQSKNILYNCSSCQKCIRTQVAFLVSGVTSLPTFKPISLKAVRAADIVGHIRHEWTMLYERLLSQKTPNYKLISAVEYMMRKPTRV
jgi:hypothetical protein